MPPSTPRIAYPANRPIGVACLTMLLDNAITPVCLIVPTGPDAEGAEEMKRLLPATPVIEGKESFRESARALKDTEPDYLLSVHFPLLIPPDFLRIPSVGTLNLHPAYLPYNRGWHTPSWAILDDTPFGATLHWIDDGLDTGPIALQRRIDVHPHDTAHSLYQRALAAEIDLFREAIPFLRNGTLPRVPQEGSGTTHKKSDLSSMRKLDLANMPGEELLRRLRALTTNKPEEAAYVEEGGMRCRVRVEIAPDEC